MFSIILCNKCVITASYYYKTIFCQRKTPDDVKSVQFLKIK